MSSANKDLGIEPSYAENFLRTKFTELFPQMEEAAALELTREGEFIPHPVFPNVSVATRFVISHFGFETNRTLAQEDAGRILVEEKYSDFHSRTTTFSTLGSYARGFVFQNHPELVEDIVEGSVIRRLRKKPDTRLSIEGNYAATIFAGCISKGVFEREMKRR